MLSVHWSFMVNNLLVRFLNIHTFDAFHDKNYRFLWISDFLTYTGRWTNLTVLAWLVHELTSSAFKVSLVGFFLMLPFLFIGLLGGFLSDNFNKKHIIVITQIINLINAGIMAFLLHLKLTEYWHAYICISVVGIAWALDMSSRRSLVLDLLGRRNLSNGIALDFVGIHLSKVIGPAIGGLLISLFLDVLYPYIFLTIIYLITIFTTYFIKNEDSTKPLQISVEIFKYNKIASSAKKISSDILAIFRYAVYEKSILAVLIITVIMNVFLFPYLPIIPVIAKDVLHVGPFLMGLLISIDGIGALSGSVTIASQSNLTYQGRIYVFGALLAVIAIFIFSFSSWYYSSLILMLLVGLACSGFATMQSVVTLTVAEDKIKGRTFGMVQVCIGTAPFGSLLIGNLASTYGPTTALMISSMIGFSLILISIIFLPNILEKNLRLSNHKK